MRKGISRESIITSAFFITVSHVVGGVGGVDLEHTRFISAVSVAVSNRMIADVNLLDAALKVARIQPLNVSSSVAPFERREKNKKSS